MVLFAPCVDDNTLAIILSIVDFTAHACTQKCVIVKFHHIVNMHDQFMGMNTIQQPLLSCLPAFYALAIPVSCYISNVFYYLFVFFFLFVLAGHFFVCFTNDC